MPYNNHGDIPTLTIAIVFALGLIGAMFNFFKRKWRGLTTVQKIGLFLLDTATSSTLAVVSFYTVIGLGYNELLAIGVAGAFSHQGTRAIYILELIVTEKLGAKATFEEIKKGDK